MWPFKKNPLLDYNSAIVLKKELDDKVSECQKHISRLERLLQLAQTEIPSPIIKGVHKVSDCEIETTVDFDSSRLLFSYVENLYLPMFHEPTSDVDAYMREQIKKTYHGFYLTPKGHFVEVLGNTDDGILSVSRVTDEEVHQTYFACKRGGWGLKFIEDNAHYRGTEL